jgi:hypothetical protein
MYLKLKNKNNLFAINIESNKNNLRFLIEKVHGPSNRMKVDGAQWKITRKSTK